MKLIKRLKISSEDFYYDLTDGGYLNPNKICADTKDAKKVIEAIKIIKDFQDSCEEQIENFIE